MSKRICLFPSLIPVLYLSHFLHFPYCSHISFIFLYNHHSSPSILSLSLPPSPSRYNCFLAHVLHPISLLLTFLPYCHVISIILSFCHHFSQSFPCPRKTVLSHPSIFLSFNPILSSYPIFLFVNPIVWGFPRKETGYYKYLRVLVHVSVTSDNENNNIFSTKEFLFGL
jgi:hypothetical protein